MPAFKRFKTNYPGVYYINGSAVASNKPERIYYFRYRKDGKQVEEKAGRQFLDDMTPAKAAKLRSLRMSGNQLSNKERREAQEAKKQESLNRWTFDRLFEEYKLRNPDLKGVKIDDNRFKNHITGVIGEKEPCELSPFEIDKLRINLSKTHKPASVKHVLELIRRLINFGIEKNLCEGTNFRIKLPKVDNMKTEDLTPEQLTRLLDAIEQDENVQAGNFMKLALFTGLRRSELFRLQWKDIDIRRGFISIRGPKGGRDQIIPMNNNAREVLQNHPKSDSLFVFPGKDGKQRTDFKKPINRIKERAGLPKDFRPLHGLRHVFASTLASSGHVDLYTLQKLLTHKSPLMTQRYAHLRDETLKQASNLMGDLVEQAINGSQDKKVVNLDDYNK